MITTRETSQHQVLPTTDSAWVAFLSRHPRATVFHHPAWSAVLSRSYGFDASVLASVSRNGEILAGLPFMTVNSRLTGSRRVALPFTDHLPPLSEPGAEMAFATSIYKWALTVGPLEIHATLPLGDRHLESVGVRHLLPLTDAHSMRGSLTTTPVGRALRKAGRSDLETSIERDLQAVRAYYDLHSKTRRRQGVPVQPWRFFRELHAGIIAAGLGMVVLARIGGRCVAGSVFLYSNSTLIYKYGASDSEHLALRPNNLVMWRAIEWGCENGYRMLDLGKTDADNLGLRRYKMGWGAKEVSHCHTVLPGSARRRSSGIAMRAAAAVIRRSPILAARAIGAVLYGHYA